MSPGIDNPFSVSQIPNVQQQSIAAAREAELAEQRQRIAARKAKEAENSRVEKEQAVEGKTIRAEDPREEHRPVPRPGENKKPPSEDGQGEKLDITL